MIMDQEVKQFCDELHNRFMKDNKDANLHFYLHTLEGRVETKLCQLANALEKAQRELEVEKNIAMVWKESYLDQVKENVRMQANDMTFKESNKYAMMPEEVNRRD